MRVLALLVVLLSSILDGYTSTPPQPQPVATFDLSQLLLPGQREATWTTIAFVSDTYIAVGLCGEGGAEKCSLSLVQWESGVLRLSAQTTKLDSISSIYPAGGGRTLTTATWTPTNLFSPDLSASLRLPVSIYLVSQSGRTVAENTQGGWKVYRLSTVRGGIGSLKSISDEVVVFQDRNVMRTETLERRVLGSFSVAPETKCYTSAELLGDNRLYLQGCKGGKRIVDFDGKERRKLHPPKGCCDYDNRSSADGSRLLFDYTSRKVSALRNVGEILVAFTLFGAADEMDNREEIQVVDTVTGGTCFDWRRRFAMGSDLRFRKIAAISPSGEFVAIAAEKTLSVFRLPSLCETKK